MSYPKVPGRTTTGFAFANLERAINECFANRQFGLRELAQAVAFFGKDPLECVYCGSVEVKRWDHLVSVRHGGETVLGNMVPACARCDDSKQAFPFETWMMSSSQWSPKTRGVSNVDERIDKIKAYIAYFNYSPRQLIDRLDDYEQEKLQAIRVRLAEARADVEALIKHHQKRTEKP